MTMTLNNTPTGSIDLDETNALLEASHPEKMVAWVANRFGENLVMTSSFGAESALLLHMASQALPDIRVVFLDTGYLFPETWQHMEQLRRRLNLNVWVYRTRNDPIAYLRSIGQTDPTLRADRNACCAVNKNEPMNRAMKELAPAAWLRGVRRDQTPERQAMRHVSWAARYNCYAISPLLDWGSKDIYAYMKRHDLPFHPLYEKGYASIGCNPLSCTRPIQAGEDDRAGRWAGTGKVECGINLTNSLDSSNL
jgi:phosphoadenosine phosphosulfate reductase